MSWLIFSIFHYRISRQVKSFITELVTLGIFNKNIESLYSFCFIAIIYIHIQNNIITYVHNTKPMEPMEIVKIQM